MGNAAIYYYPDNGAILRIVDLGAPLSRLDHYPVREMESATAYSGATSRAIYSGQSLVSVQLSRIRDPAVVAELEAFVSYAGRGGVFSIVEDTDYLFAGFARYRPAPGVTSLQLLGNQFSAFGSVPLTGPGDSLTLRGPSPRMLIERPFVSVRSGDAVTLSAGVINDWRDEEWVFVRDPRFWPYVRVREGAESAQMIRSDERRVTHTLTLDLIEASEAIAAAAELPEDQAWPGDIVPGTVPGGPSDLEGFGQLGAPTAVLDQSNPFGGVFP